ncbi:MAG: ABC transporter permease [Rhodanobacter denitrificans]|uniref:ABC transporter permease n=1 Tax=Rhodanobacter denitrificans TaxID=666685 RepID=A0A2W5KV16_9GAMM|nr:MAG: ABC transporter permease [Rhodanobacter denitrificans]
MAAATVSRPGRASSFVDAWSREIAFLRGSMPELAMITVLPLILVATLAWLLSDAVIRDLPIAVVDHDRSDISRELIRRLDASAGLSVVEQPPELSRAWSLVRRLTVYAVVYVPNDLRRDIQRGDAAVFVYYNASLLTAGQGASRDVASVVAGFDQAVLRPIIALRSGVGAVGRPPLAVQSTLLFNSARSYEHFLLGLLFPGVLHLVAALAMVSALGRELRDGTGAGWLARSADRYAAIAGKLAPYVLLFAAYGSLGVLYLAYARGGGIAGSLGLLLVGQLGLYGACATVSLFLVGLTRDMGSALSMVGLYIGTALAFSGATFPVIEGPLFTRVWNALLPLTAYVRLQVQQVDIGAPWRDSMTWIGALALFVAVPGLIGMVRYARVVTAPERPA